MGRSLAGKCARVGARLWRISYFLRTKKGPASAGPWCPLRVEIPGRDFLHHAAHVGHAAGHAATGVVFGSLGDDRLGHEDVLGDRRGVLERRAGHLGRVDDAGFDQVAVLTGSRVQAFARLQLPHLVDHDRALLAGVLGDLTDRLLERAVDDPRARLLVRVLQLLRVETGLGVQQRDATTRHDALLERGAGRLQRVLDAVLFLLHLGLRGGADLDHRNAPGELRQTLLEFFPIEVGVGVLDLLFDLLDPAFDVVALARTIDDRGVVFGDDDAAGLTELGQLGVLQFETHLLGDDLATGEDRDVLEHPLTTVAEARGFDGHTGEGAAELVDDQRREALALDVLGHDQERFAPLHHLLEHRQDVPHGADFLVGDEDVGVLQHRLHAVLVGDHVRRDIAFVELHSLGELQLHAEGLALLDIDDAVFADFLDRVGDHVADVVVTGGNRGDASDLVFAGDLFALHLAEVLDDAVDSLLDAAAQGQGVGAGGPG